MKRVIRRVLLDRGGEMEILVEYWLGSDTMHVATRQHSDWHNYTWSPPARELRNEDEYDDGA